ncbi:MAG: PAS domain S-box protein [Candidatus Viridilinea halotolerans]|uniref:Circadian input-output histidine kinase CikA n=1 Tax=Candidatus Viridilinea halotolerans TaxID=2491704 RepID=A0A426U5J1_9CHLR|nr:MAG: PAS domain S-box protein [Candidatus Viridilinea halotolerans]
MQDAHPSPPQPANEEQRIATLRRCRILDTMPEQFFDDLTAVASYICETPIAAVSLVDRHRQWFKAQVGLTDSETPRNVAFCAHTILDPVELLEVHDALDDVRFRTSTLVTENPHIRFYAGTPLTMRDGTTLGALCVVDTVPRELNEKQRAALAALGRSVVNELELRLNDALARELVEHELQASEAKFRGLNDSLDSAIIIVDRNGHCLYANEVTANLLGQTSAAIVNASLAQIFPALVEEQAVLIRQVLQSNSGRVVEAALSLQTEHRWFRISMQPIRGDDGRAMCVLINATDIHTLKTTQEQLIELNQAIAAQAEAVHELARNEIARTMRMRTDFLASVSHELRTPLNAILGLSESMLDGVCDPLTPLQVETVNQIYKSGNQLLNLISDVLDLSKIESDRLQLECEAVLVADVCRASLRFVHEQVRQKQQRLAFTLNNELAIMEVDHKRLRQMLGNLLSNAVKFTPPGGTIALEVELDATTEQAIFRVRDTGIGISQEDQAHIFEPFSKLDNRLNRDHEGTGLGLILVRRLTELHGGTVSVMSEPGVGSCFTIILPYRPMVL